MSRLPKRTSAHVCDFCVISALLICRDVAPETAQSSAVSRFLTLYSYGVLPGIFAWPAGLGDMAIGVTAPLVLSALLRRPGFAAGKSFVAWNDQYKSVFHGRGQKRRIGGPYQRLCRLIPQPPNKFRSQELLLGPPRYLYFGHPAVFT